MRFRLAFILIAAIIFGSCAGAETSADNKKPIFMRIYSADTAVKEQAWAEFNVLEPSEKKDTLDKAAEQLSSEKDADTQTRVLDCLNRLGDGGAADIYLIQAEKRNPDLLLSASLRDYINSVSPPPDSDLAKITVYLKGTDWNVRQTAMYAAGRMSSRARQCVPEVIDTMHEFGDDQDRYAESFYTLAKIDPEIAVTALIVDLHNRSAVVRKNSLSKLIEIKSYMSAGLPALKEVVPALLGVMYGDDAALKNYMDENIKGKNAESTRMELENYSNSGSELFKGLMRSLGVDAREMFRQQQERMDRKMKQFYREIGREKEFDEKF
jgi:hypothetical protein